MIPIFLIGLVAPFIVFTMILAAHGGALILPDHLMYLILVVIVVSYSIVPAFYYYRLYATNPRKPLFFASLAMLAFGVIFGVHGLSVLPYMNGSPGQGRVFDISEHYSLFVSVLFLIGLALPFKEDRGVLYRYRQAIYGGTVILLALGCVILFGSASFANMLYGMTNLAYALAFTISVATAAYLTYRYEQTHDRILPYFILGLLFIASAAYIPYFYTEWDLLWWYMHLLFPLGYTAIFVGIINYHRGDLGFSLFFGELPFYRKIGSKIALIMFMTGLLPLLAFGLIVFGSVTTTFGSGIPTTQLPNFWYAGSLDLLIFRFITMVELLAVLAAFFSFYFVSKLTQPLHELREAAGRIAKGEDGVRIRLTTGDEIEQLADSFNIMSTEITERTRELARERARLTSSIESLSLGFIIADLHDQVIMKNAAIGRILDLPDDFSSVKDLIEDMKGTASELDLLSHSCRECVELKEAVELKEVLHGTKYLRVFCTPVIPKGEEAIGYVILVEDITEAKVMERSRDEFFAVASHELRTPLTAIRGNADMILDMYRGKRINPDLKEMLEDINSSSVRLIQIVNDFLEVSRLEQGKIDIKKERFAVPELVEKVVRDLRAIAESKKLALSFIAPLGSLPDVFADRARTEQVLVNLIGNALKFTKEGGITITVALADRFVGVRVTDTGLGISAQNQSLLFRKFQQAGEQMLARDVTQSTGLGLYISKLIMSAMGGTIGLEQSELGKGSTFMFSLPVAA